MHTVITGATGAIGEATARRFAHHGPVTLVARRADALQDLADSLPTARVLVADLCDPVQVATVVSRAVASSGPITTLVNNAGMQFVEPIHRVDSQRTAQIIQLNTTTPLQLMADVLPQMVEAGRGTVVNICSLAALTPLPGSSHYSATKAALATASEAAYTELKETGVHVLTVYPGPVHSPMHDASAHAYGTTQSWLPVGDPLALAEAIDHAMDRRQRRLIFPKAYRPAWTVRGLAALVVERCARLR